MRRRHAAARGFAVAALLAAAVGCQFWYDAARPAAAASLPPAFTPEMTRLADMGFHPAVASFLWANTMPSILDLFFRGHTEYLSGLAFLTSVDPKFGYPYAFSVLTLPVIPTSSYPDAVGESFKIGKEGLANADPDWRIPYYMAINYYLERHDLKDAARYFNLAATTPGVPEYAASFALNFGVDQRNRDRVRNLWITVYKSSNDPATKARAAAYIARLNDLDYLDAASKAYKARFGAYPTSTAALVARGIIPAVPVDPFGYSFIIRKDGASDVNTSKPPSYLFRNEQAQVLP